MRPADALITQADHLVIAPDGGLHLLPFAALVRRDDRGSAQYMVEWKSLTTTASATVYAELRKRPRPQAWAAEQVVVFADPKYPQMAVTAARRDGGNDDRNRDWRART